MLFKSLFVWRRSPVAVASLASLAVAISACGRGLPGPTDARATAPRPATTRLHAPGQITLFTQPESGSGAIVGAIDGARHSVWLQMYMVTDPVVVEALGRAAARGLEVRVLLEETPAQPGQNRQVAADLEARGVLVAWTNPAFSLTHAKTMLIDGEVAYVLTYNLTRAATASNRELAVIDRAQSDVAELKRIFVADWNREAYMPVDPDLVVSPENARRRILGLMTRARRELLVGVEVLNDAEVVATLVEQRRAGVDVRVLVGSVRKLPANLPAARTLVAQGVPTRSQGRPYLHAKYMVADGERAYLGSINLSSQSLDSNRELGLLIGEGPAIGQMRDVFLRDWGGARDPEADAPEARRR
ncbi:MAG: phospholipase D-like domain-containing protein [Candidatus Sericytochromatia bacterium]|nr:phospholipase D-like domain-containing protein [Candidatus Sericytochromatia bacterium]